MRKVERLVLIRFIIRLLDFYWLLLSGIDLHKINKKFL